jgi:predicted phage-related endonuclease
LSKYKTRIDVWLDIMESRQPGFAARQGYKWEPFEGNDATRVGNLFEDTVIQAAEDRQGIKICQREAVYTCQPEDFITCHIDGMYDTTGKGKPKTLHEGKTAGIFAYRESWGEPETDAIPEDYQVQCQHQMLATGADLNIVSVLVLPISQSDIVAACPLDEIDQQAWLKTLIQMGLFFQYPVARNEEAISKMKAKYREFWEVNVLGEKPPGAVDYADLRKVFQAPTGTVIAGAEQEMWSAEYKALGEEQSEIKRQKEELKMRLISWAKAEGEREGIVVDKDSGKKLIIKSRDGIRLHGLGKKFT